MPVNQKVKFHSLVKSLPLTNRNKLRRFIEYLFKSHGKKLESLQYIFCSDRYLLKINRRFLNHDTLTDIVTFDLSESAGVVGEVYISIDRVRENAARFEVSFTRELHRVIFHGALHLCDFSDKTKSQKAIMTVQEDLCLTRYYR